jgi:uncharacterized membrane protein
MKPNQPAQSREPEEGGRGPTLIVIMALFGVACSSLQNDGYVYELLTYHVIGVTPRQWPGAVLAFGHGLLWLVANRCWGVSSQSIARAVLPLAALSVYAVPVVFNLRLGFMGPLLANFAVGWSAFRLFSRCRFPAWQPPRWLGWSLVASFAAAFTVGMYALQAIMYRHLLLGYSDIGYYYLRLRNSLVHDAFLTIDSANPTFWDHFCPGLGLFLPFFSLWQDPKFLMFLQPLCFAITGLLLYALARREAPQSRATLLIPIIFFFYPAVTQLPFNYSYGFHPASVALPLVVLGVYLMDKGRHGWAALAAIVATSMQEHIPIYFVGFGAVLFLRKKWRAGSTWMILGSAYILYIFLVYMPSHTGGENVHVSLFWGELGDSVPEIAMSVLTRPGFVLSALFDSTAFYLWALLLLPLFGTSLGAPRILIGLLPVTLFNLLRFDEQGKSIAFQYQTGTIGLLFLAAILALYPAQSAATSRIGRWFRRQRPVAFLGAALLVCFHASFNFSLLPWSQRSLAIIPEQSDMARNAIGFQQIGYLVPADATVTADDRTRGVLMDRRLVLDFREDPRWPTNYHVYLAGAWSSIPEETETRVKVLLDSGEWEQLAGDQGLYILRRIEPAPQPPPDIF